MNLIRFVFSKTFVKQILLAVVALVVITLGVLQYLKHTTNHGEFVLVPDLSKKTLSEVTSILDEARLQAVILDSANYNPEYPSFSVIEQDPLPAREVKEGRKIYLTLNPSGYKKVSVPNVIQKTRRNAESMLRAVGLEVGEVTYIDELGKDMVYGIKYKGSDIEVGDQLGKTSKVELVCGNGNRKGGSR